MNNWRQTAPFFIFNRKYTQIAVNKRTYAPFRQGLKAVSTGTCVLPEKVCLGLEKYNRRTNRRTTGEQILLLKYASYPP
jgi:hypothetical protein